MCVRGQTGQAMELNTNFRLVPRFKEHMELCLHVQHVFCPVDVAVNVVTWDSFRDFNGKNVKIGTFCEKGKFEHRILKLRS